VIVPRAPRLLLPVLLLAPLAAGISAAADLPPALELPKPKLDAAVTLVSALKARKSAREFSPAPLSLQALSDLLWAADGVNRDDGRRTAPSAKNWQEVDVYAVLHGGAYLYDAKAHALRGVASGDLRAATGVQDFVATAPLNLVYVADLARMSGASPGDRDLYAAADAAFISENVYLWCAGTGLSTVVRGSVDRPALAKALGLRPDQKILLAQTVGLPK
jgi:nitroreductase